MTLEWDHGMTTELQSLDHEIIGRYTDQPARLPAALRQRIEASWNGAPVQLYALADLDEALRLTEAWVALGPGHVTVARVTDGRHEWDLMHIERARIEAVREAPGLSASTLTILGRPGDPALAVLRYSHRQRRAFENLTFVLEEALAAGRRGAVIRRLLGYLRPYRRQLVLGMAAATLITLVSLVPPYLAGYVIDRVVRPARSEEHTS